jgi:hypothetical protein
MASLDALYRSGPDEAPLAVRRTRSRRPAPESFKADPPPRRTLDRRPGRRVGPYGRTNDRFPWALTRDRSTEATYYYATWHPERELLQVNWFTRRIEGAYTASQWHDGHSEVPPCGMEWGVAFGVEVGNSYSFDKTGKLVEHHAVGPESFQKVLPLSSRYR